MNKTNSFICSIRANAEMANMVVDLTELHLEVLDQLESVCCDGKADRRLRELRDKMRDFYK